MSRSRTQMNGNVYMLLVCPPCLHEILTHILNVQLLMFTHISDRFIHSLIVLLWLLPPPYTFTFSSPSCHLLFFPLFSCCMTLALSLLALAMSPLAYKKACKCLMI